MIQKKKVERFFLEIIDARCKYDEMFFNAPLIDAFSSRPRQISHEWAENSTPFNPNETVRFFVRTDETK
jgi:hypothetical protein